MKYLIVACIALIGSTWGGDAHAIAHTAPDSVHAPLAPFDRLVGGAWYLGDTYQEFEWGVGRQTVRSRSYAIIEGQPKLVAEGFWYWHPAEKRIKAIFVAVEMPVVLFEYATHFDADRMVNELYSYEADGDVSTYRETWTFTDEDHYTWSLQEFESAREVMTGIYARRW